MTRFAVNLELEPLETNVMLTHKAWMSPEGTITEVKDHHEAIALIGTTDPYSAVKRGWTRLWVWQTSGRDSDLLVQGRLENLERHKDDILAWAGYPKSFALQVMLPDGREVSVSGTSEDLMESSIQSLAYRTRVAERAIARQPGVRVREHRRRA
jgi:hypothetical protein